jgi:hypothetical protein
MYLSASKIPIRLIRETPPNYSYEMSGGSSHAAG